MRDVIFDRKTNPGLLHQQLAAALGTVIIGCSQNREQLIVHVADDMPTEMESQIAVLVAAHNEAELTPVQAVEREADTAEKTLAGMITNRIAWHEANQAVAGNAVQVVQRMQAEWLLYMKFIRRQLRTEDEGSG